MITISAGMVILVENRILLCHPTNAGWKGTFSIPKGLVESGEDYLQTAFRECKEEVGLDLKKIMPNLDIKNNGIANYIKKDKLVKQVHYFVIRASLKDLGLKDLGLNDWIIPKTMLQVEEVDWAGFLTKEEAKEKIFWRLREVIDFL